MDLYEYQAKELFVRHGVPTTEGDVCTTPAEAEAVAWKVGGPVVVKAQVKTGGRGKAGGVKLADNPKDACDKADGRGGEAKKSQESSKLQQQVQVLDLQRW